MAAKACGVVLGGFKLAEARERAAATNKALADAYAARGGVLSGPARARAVSTNKRLADGYAANVLPVIREKYGRRAPRRCTKSLRL